MALEARVRERTWYCLPRKRRRQLQRGRPQSQRQSLLPLLQPLASWAFCSVMEPSSYLREKRQRRPGRYAAASLPFILLDCVCARLRGWIQRCWMQKQRVPAHQHLLRAFCTCGTMVRWRWSSQASLLPMLARHWHQRCSRFRSKAMASRCPLWSRIEVLPQDLLLRGRLARRLRALSAAASRAASCC